MDRKKERDWGKGKLIPSARMHNGALMTKYKADLVHSKYICFCPYVCNVSYFLLQFYAHICDLLLYK